MEGGTIDVFKKIKLPRFSGGGRLRQRGQVILLYALLIPMLFFFVGMTFDLSWYYINVSRMQNAADAAAVAGAQTLTSENGSLYYCMGKTFVNGYNGKTVRESYQDTSFGDRTAKTYVGKNMALKDSEWNRNSIVDFWTRNELQFNSLLLSEVSDTGILYYHVMLEEEVPHMFLQGLSERFPMNAKVSSVVMINQYMKGYDFYNQMKSLGDKQAYPSLDTVNNIIEHNKTVKNEDDKKEINMGKAHLIKVETDESKIPIIETFKLSDDFDTQKIFNNLFAGSKINDTKSSKVIHRIIDIDMVYPVRDYKFYSDYRVLEKIREYNSSYDDMSNSELATALAKEDSADPLFIRIESETDFARQVIINVNVSNMNESTDRPIVLFYEGATNGDSYPVIVNLNEDFRGVVFAPNSPVVINGNDHEFKGFVIADSYVELMTEDDYWTDENFVDRYFDSDNVEYFKTGYGVFVDYSGEVQYKKGSIDPKKFNLVAEFDSFGLVKFETYKPEKTKIFFTRKEAEEINRPTEPA